MGERKKRQESTWPWFSVTNIKSELKRGSLTTAYLVVDGNPSSAFGASDGV